MDSKGIQTRLQEKAAAELWIHLAGQDFRLVGKTIRIGRAADNDIVIDDKSISRYHALITILSDQIILEDLKSRNGTRVNGSKIRRAELLDRDELRVGDIKGSFHQKSKLSDSIKNIKPPEELRKIAVEVSKIANVEGLKRAGKGLKTKWDSLTKKKKILFMVAGVLGLFLLVALISGGEHSPSQNLVADVSSMQQAVNAPVERKSLERCVELEDLGSYRQAAACYKQLPATQEIKLALSRVSQIQADLSKKRYTEGEQAFRNYYYDVAIQKWQEVLLIADDESTFFAEAYRGIQQAEQLKGKQ